MMTTWSNCSLTRLSFEPINERQSREKSGGQEAQALGRSRAGNPKIHIAADDYDWQLYREGRLSEHLINNYRRVFSRFEKLSKNYLGFLSLSAHFFSYAEKCKHCLVKALTIAGLPVSN